MKKENLFKRIVEKYGFTLEEEGIQTFTPLGEDWHISIDPENMQNFLEIAYTLESEIDYTDETTALYIEERGKHGIPSDIMDLVKDGEWKKKTLEKMAKEFKKRSDSK